MGKICKNCYYWTNVPEMTFGAEKQTVSTGEMLCGKSKEASHGAYGQDGKAIITAASFGCNQWKAQQ